MKRLFSLEIKDVNVLLFLVEDYIIKTDNIKDCLLEKLTAFKLEIIAVQNSHLFHINAVLTLVSDVLQINK